MQPHPSTPIQLATFFLSKHPCQAASDLCHCPLHVIVDLGIRRPQISSLISAAMTEVYSTLTNHLLTWSDLLINHLLTYSLCFWLSLSSLDPWSLPCLLIGQGLCSGLIWLSNGPGQSFHHNHRIIPFFYNIVPPFPHRHPKLTFPVTAAKDFTEHISICAT